MPQVQPGQVTPGQDGAPQLYGVNKPVNNIPFQAKLMELFKAHEYVTIKNIYGESIYWQYLAEEDEEINMSEDGLQRQIYRKEPQLWMLEAGQTEVIVGASAYRALDAMYKAVSAAKTLKRFRDPSSPQFDEKGQHLPKNFNYADAGAQDDFIRQAYLGKAIPTFQGQVATPPPAPAMPQAAVANGPAAPQPNQGGQTAGADTIATSQSNPGVQPMTATPPADDAPKPKTTEGAPLVAPTYAKPDDEADEQPAPKPDPSKLVKTNEPATAKK